MGSDPSYQGSYHRLQGADVIDVKPGGQMTADGTQASNVADVEEAYEAGELDNEAKLIVAINANGAAINAILAALEGVGIMASS